MPDDLVVHFKRPLDWRNTINIHYWNTTPTTTPFSQALTLPTKVDASQGKAKFKDNVLELILPKSAKRCYLKVD